MENRYDYCTFDRIVNPVTSVSQELMRLGDEGWEVMRLTGSNSAESRRLVNGEGPQSWEYHQFDHDLYPIPEGLQHLAGCGWIRIDPELRAYDRTTIYLFKRPGWLRGTDDGDIMARLTDHGITKSDIYSMKWLEPGAMSSVHQLFHAILCVKWLRSERNGRDMGTYDAVRQWLSYEYIPNMMKIKGFKLPQLDGEDMLDELLVLRESMRQGHYPPPLSVIIEKWNSLRA